jgi:hypothetical protein
VENHSRKWLVGCKLPHVVRQINPGLARLWIDDTTRQYGANSEVVLANLSNAQFRALDYLETGISDNQLPLLPKMASADTDVTNGLLERLPTFTENEISRRFSEIMRLYLIGLDDPAETMRARKSLRVFLSKLDRTGLTLLKTLNASAITNVFTNDHSKVLPGDTLEMGYPQSLLGTQRVRAAKSMADELSIQLHSRVSAAFDQTDLAILLCHDIIHPADYQPWLSRDVPHLAICFDESGVQISHIVIPGVTPCLGCIELHRIKNVPNWIKIATQLTSLDRDLADSALMLFSGGVALTKSLNYLDGLKNQQPLAMIRLERSGDVVTSEANWSECGCRNAL